MSNLLKAASSQIICFFKQTFRRHTGVEYSEFLTRGVRRRDGIQRAYPWFYIRLFAACIIIFAVYLLIVRFTSNVLYVPVTVILGAIAFGIPFLVLMYEIYPRRDLSLLSVFITLLIGGTGSHVLAQITFALLPVQSEWLLALRTAGVEELAKAIAVIITLAVLKVKQPLVGFILGAAVGCGFSLVEDAGYIFVGSNDLTYLNISSVVSVTFERGLSAFCTHTVWSAAVGWAFASARRPFLSLRLYLCLVGAVAVHLLWDAPFSYGWHIFAVVVCVAITAAYGIPTLAITRMNTFRAAGVSPTPQFFRADEQSLRRDKLYYTHAGHLCLTVGAFIMAVIAIIYCTFPFRETYYPHTFTDKKEFISFMQCGYELSDDFTRGYDPALGNYEEQSTGNTLTSVTQRVEEGEYFYYYEYTVAGSGESAVYLLNTVSVELRINGVSSRYFMETAYDMPGRLYASYFHIRSDISGYNISADGNEITVIEYNPLFEFDYSQPQYVALFGSLGSLAAISLGLYVMFYVKSLKKRG